MIKSQRFAPVFHRVQHTAGQLSRALTTMSVAAVALLLLPAQAPAQSKYPDRPLRMLVGSQAGGATDVAARKFSLQLQQVLGQPVSVENKTGAGGLIAAIDTAKAAPDGYTLQLGSTSNNLLAPQMQTPPPVDLLKDFVTVNVVGLVPIALFVNTSVEARTLPELVSLIKKSPGKFSYGSGGVGTTSHMAMELFKTIGGNLDIQHIPYRGGPGMVSAVMAGEVPMAVDALVSTIALHQSGKIRILAILSQNRTELMPDMPTAVEQGLKEMVSEVSFYILAPANTPAPVVDTLFTATSKVANSDTWRSEMLKSNIQPLHSSSQAAAAQYTKAEAERWRATLAKHMAKPN